MTKQFPLSSDQLAKSPKKGITLPKGMVPVLKLAPMPSDANFNGDIFGGWVMSQVDIAGSIPAIEVVSGRLATVAVNSFIFKEPIYVGDLVSFFAKVIKIGKTSVTVEVEVYSQRRLAAPVSESNNYEAVKVTEATLTYVAIDKNGRPRKIEKKV